MSTGTGSTGGAGQGYRVEVEQLRTFAGHVRVMLRTFQNDANGTTTHGRTAVGKSAFGTFAEATELHERYQSMRDALRDILNALEKAVDDAQRNAELTATGYEEHENHTAKSLKLAGDGWSAANSSAAAEAAYRTNLHPTASRNTTVS
ncbi:hypothetical protein [Streptomyces rubellomurinus]|uniref:WXG100 family type VII secretion target n=1 Tax=Streptomyces rubellomurinus (strain ATCC 31215) TaxID=359131 RepID=A0A0F2TF53_STRR3|nr:hypothetical protein [Streptomyces rubellomurinus]KJS61774.1 hypothetical protein VM95_13140 [Streptomyces rubellomurinus]